MRLLPFRYFITKRYLFHFTLKSLVVTILTRPYFFLNPPPFLFSEIFGNITEDLTTVLSQGNSWFISVPPPPSILCSVERAQFRAGNFTRIFSSLVCFATAISGPLLFFFFSFFTMNVLLLTGVCVQHLLSVQGKVRGQQNWWGMS